MRYVAVNQSKEETYIVTMEKGGLNIIHEGASSATQNTQSEVNITLEVSDITTSVTPLT